MKKIMINEEDYRRYQMLKKANETGANLAPVDFEFIHRVETQSKIQGTCADEID